MLWICLCFSIWKSVNFVMSRSIVSVFQVIFHFRKKQCFNRPSTKFVLIKHTAHTMLKRCEVKQQHLFDFFFFFFHLFSLCKLFCLCINKYIFHFGKWSFRFLFFFSCFQLRVYGLIFKWHQIMCKYGQLIEEINFSVCFFFLGK